MDEQNKAILTTGNIAKQLLLLTLPMIVGQVSIVIFNITDTFFISRLGEEQLAAISFTFPVVTVINSFAAGIGIGAGALIARYLGEGNMYKVRRLTTDTLILGFFFILLLSIIGVLTIKPMFRMLGATESVLVYIEDYMSIWYYGSFIVVLTMISNNIQRALGDTKTPGIIMLVSALLNAIFDPLLIFGIWFFPRMEMKGAALTTVLSRIIVAIMAIYILGYKRKLIVLKRVKLKELFASWREVLHIGIPSASIRLALPIGSGIVTRLLSTSGQLVVAGFGVATRIEFFALAPITALSSVMSPFVGQNLGAGKLSRVRKGRVISQNISLIIGGSIAVLLWIFARPLALLFNDNPAVVETIVQYLRIVPIAYGLAGILQISSTILNVLKMPYLSSGLMGMHIFLIYVPLALISHRFFGGTGVFASLAISYIVAGLIALSLVRKKIGELEVTSKKMT
ncbi:MAG: MATE family efflux transporter [Candidatus Cloacimonas sp.]|nr:MATE family efflux transporter [Candidatus Cloacimonadota bacterium]